MKLKFKRLCSAVLSIAIALSIISIPTVASADSTGPNLLDRSTWWEYTGYYSKTYWDGTNGTHAYRQETYGSGKVLETAADALEYLETTVACTNFARHIYSYEATGGDKQLLFVGYPASGGTDFTIYPEEETSMKSVGFDIDFYNASSHTLGGLGILFNAKIVGQSADGSGGTLYGYQLLYDNSGSGFSGNLVIKRLNGVSADNFFNTRYVSTAETIETLSSFSFPGVSSGSGSPTFVSGDTTKIRVDMEFDNTYVSIKIKHYDKDGIELTAKSEEYANVDLTPYPLSDPGTGYGPFVNYKSHACSILTYIKFGNFQMANGYLVDFRLNYQDGSANDGVYKQLEVEKDNNGVGNEWPTVPSRDGYVFIGWNTKADGTGETYTKDTVITGTVTLYAQWDKASVTVEYDPDHTWTQDPVNVTVSAKLVNQTIDPTGVVKDASGTVIDTFTLTYNSTNDTYEATWPVTENFTGYTIKVTGDDGTGEKVTVTSDYAVTWIDLDAPTIAGIPNVSANNNILSSGDMSSLTFADPDTDGASLSGSANSGVDDSSKKVLFYLVKEDGSLAEPVIIAWSDLATKMPSLTPGRYFYDIVVEDNVGHVTYASSTYYSDGTNEGTGKGGDREDGTLGDLIGGGGSTGSETGVVINATEPTITFISDGQTIIDDQWYNTDVKVTVNANDDFFNIESVDVTGDAAYNATGIGKQSFTGTDVITLTDEGIYTLDGTTVNELNLDGSTTITIKIDKTAPTVTFGSETTLNDLTVTAEDPELNDGNAGSGVVTQTYSLKDSSGTPIGNSYNTWEDVLNALESNNISGIYTLTVDVTDAAGNSETYSVSKLYTTSGGDSSSLNPNAAKPNVMISGGEVALTQLKTSSTLTITIADASNGVSGIVINDDTANILDAVGDSADGVKVISYTATTNPTTGKIIMVNVTLSFADVASGTIINLKALNGINGYMEYEFTVQ